MQPCEASSIPHRRHSTVSNSFTPSWRLLRCGCQAVDAADADTKGLQSSIPSWASWVEVSVLHSRLMDRRARAQSLQQSVAELKMFIPQMICGEKEYQNQTYKCSDGIPKYYVGYKCPYLCPSHRRKSSNPLNIDLSEGTLVAPECFHRRKAASSRRRFLKGL